MRTLICFFFCIITSVLQSQNLSKQDSLQINSIIEDWNISWDVKDYKLAAKWYSNDAKFVNAFGDVKNGKNEIEQLLKEVFSLPFVMSGKSETKAQTFQILNDNVVIIHTSVERKGQKMPEGSNIEKRITTHLRVFEKNSNQWQIKSHLISDARDKQSKKH
jgi:uncharacterized protein (TIGR02246 family)